MPENLTFEDLGPSLVPSRKAEGSFQSVGVIGLGVMGRGIVETISNAGIEVIGIEKDAAALQNAMEGLGRTMDNEIKRWSKTASEKRAILSRVKGETDLSALRDCEIVIEAVDENFEAKKKVMQDFYALGKSYAIFISNTATLSLSKLANASPHPEKIIGMHFLNPVPQVALVEIVRGMKTSDETYERVKAFASRIGKTPVEVFEYPGFITTRTILPMLNEAMHLLMEGNAKADAIDTAMRLG